MAEKRELASLPHRCACVFDQRFRRAPAGKELLYAFPTLTPGVQLLGAHDSLCQSQGGCCGAELLNIHPDRFMVKSHTEQIC